MDEWVECSEYALPDAVNLREILGRIEAHLVMFIHVLMVHEEFYPFKSGGGVILTERSKLFSTKNRVWKWEKASSGDGADLICERCLASNAPDSAVKHKKFNLQAISMQINLIRMIYMHLDRNRESFSPVQRRTVRQIYYMSKNFQSKCQNGGECVSDHENRINDAGHGKNEYNTVSNSINELCLFFSSSRHLFGIEGEPRGRVCGGPFNSQLTTTLITPQLVDFANSLLKKTHGNGTNHAHPKNTPPIGHILIIEKEGIFEYFIKYNLLNFLLPNSILICSCGYPDLLTRRLVKSLETLSVAQFLGERSMFDLNCRAPVLVITDLNPGGAAIMSTFRFGSEQLSYESNELKVQIGWLGMHCDDVRKWTIDKRNFQEYGRKDHEVLKSLLSYPFSRRDSALKAELKEMKKFCKKVELQAMIHPESGDRLCREVLKRIYARRWI